jgi:tRNA U34 5-methylaminomethyl-2-thiouridine-forming methyltransferase MnmC
MLPPPPPGFEWRQTGDQSWTLYDPEFNESMHGRDGAWGETQVRFIGGCEIARKWKEQSTLAILDVGIGLFTGLVALVALQQQLQKEFPGQTFRLHYIGLELKSELISWGKTYGQKYYETFLPKEVVALAFAGNSDLLQVDMIEGDAKETFPKWKEKNPTLFFDAIFQDAYSPKNNPLLWDTTWFSLLKTCTHPQTILSTFSAASKVKQSLAESGWIVSEGPLYGSKRGSTIAKPTYTPT